MCRVVWTACAVFLAGAVGGSALPDEQAEMKALVDKALKAMGGADKVAKLKAAAWKGKGTLHIEGAEAGYTEESTTQLPNQLRFDMELDVNGQKANQLLIVSGDKGWIKVGEQTVDMPKHIHAALKDYFYALGLAITPTALLEKEVKLAPLGEVKVGEKSGVGVHVSQKGRRDVNLYFDRATGLPLKIEMTAGRIEDEMEVNFEFLFDEYKELEGVSVCTKMTWKRDGKVYLEREISEVKPQANLDDSVFAKP
jgi:hypothetical protein